MIFDTLLESLFSAFDEVAPVRRVRRRRRARGGDLTMDEYRAMVRALSLPPDLLQQRSLPAMVGLRDSLSMPQNALPRATAASSDLLPGSGFAAAAARSKSVGLRPQSTTSISSPLAGSTGYPTPADPGKGIYQIPTAPQLPAR